MTILDAIGDWPHKRRMWDVVLALRREFPALSQNSKARPRQFRAVGLAGGRSGAELEGRVLVGDEHERVTEDAGGIEHAPSTCLQVPC
jgi:hypothetical protein